MRKLFTAKRILLSVLIVFIFIQFFRIDKSNPPVDSAQDFVVSTSAPEPIQKILKSACYDCHSYETQYPWYSNLAPVSWWLKNHINEGREEMNFSNWGTFSAKKKDHKLEECIELVDEGEMPLSAYTWIHGESRLTAEDRKTLTSWFRQVRAAL